MIPNYIFLLKSTPRFFLFSISGVFFSAPGQTFLISLAIPAICSSIGISSLTFAAIYSSATLFASIFLPLIGRMVDQWPIKKTIRLNTIFFFCSILTFSLTNSLPLLFIALFFMRLFGQGSITLTATSLTIKHFKAYRGTALSITQLGYPLSEFIFPGVLLYLLNLVGWRHAFLILSVMILIFYYPLSMFGMKYTKPINNKSCSSGSKSLAYALKDVFFPFYVALSSIPPIMMTGALYFQVDIFNNNLWPLTNIAVAIFCYALFKFINTLLIGPIIDRFGVVFPLFFLTASIGLSTLLISLKGPPMLGLVYYSLYGLGLGASASTMSYLWGLLYGSDYIGEIKGVIAIIRNGATAIAPIGFSSIMHVMNVPLISIFYYSGLFILMMSLLPFIFYRLDPRLRMH